MKIGIIGCGAYGTALASVLIENNNDVTMYTNNETEKEYINLNRKSLKVDNYVFPEYIKITSSLDELIEGKELIVIAVPALYFNDVTKKMNKFLKKEQHICIATKGIENETCYFLEEIFKKNNPIIENVAVISGGAFAVDILEKAPVGLTLATNSNKTAILLKKCFNNNYFKLKVSDDIIGTEVCGAVKNVMAIAAGILNGMGITISTESLFLTEALNDVKILIENLGGKEETILNYAGFGDIFLTCTSNKSRNFTFGFLIGNGSSSEVLEEYKNNNTIEGLYTLNSVYKLIKTRNIDLPIIELIHEIVYESKDPLTILNFLIEK